jgi:hypothetical protein
MRTWTRLGLIGLAVVTMVMTWNVLTYYRIVN